jgi:vesicle transport protein SEC22
MTPKSYPKRAIFRYLGEVAQEFAAEVTQECGGGDWRQAVATVGRPYAYIKFDRQLQAKRRQYADPRRMGQASQLDTDLADIHNIMRRNIDEVLNRGERLDALVETSQSLRSEAGKYKWGAKKFSLMVAWQQHAPLIALGFIVAFVVYLKVRF